MFTFKTSCPKCAKPKALKTIAHLSSGSLTVSKAKCYKCGFTLPAQSVPTGK